MDGLTSNSTMNLSTIKNETDYENEDQMNRSNKDNAEQPLDNTVKEEQELLDKLKKEEMEEESHAITNGNNLGEMTASKKEDNVSDPLSIFSSAAMGRAAPHSTLVKPEAQIETAKKDAWYTVGFVKGNSCEVQNYFLADDDTTNITIDNLPDYSSIPRITLEPGTAYKFRVAAINSCGQGEWSEISAFKTCLPGYPGAPSAIKITRIPNGAHLSWKPPQTMQCDIKEYSVYLAVRSSNPKAENKTTSPGQLSFVRVYCGTENACVVSTMSLAVAHVDTSAEAAIIFRLAARNDKGYGPATQVRWLQRRQEKR